MLKRPGPRMLLRSPDWPAKSFDEESVLAGRLPGLRSRRSEGSVKRFGPPPFDADGVHGIADRNRRRWEWQLALTSQSVGQREPLPTV